VSTLKERQRAAARARLEREMAARQANAQHRRKNRIVGLSSALALIVVVGLVVFVVNATGGGSKKTPVASETLNAPVKCVWAPNPALTATGDAKDKALVNTGVPPAAPAPTTGTRPMVMQTNQGDITITLDLAKSPCAAQSMQFLALKKFFDNSTCHRLTTDGIYVLQCGDPSGTGAGGPGYTFPHEYLPTNDRPNYPAGVVAMANPTNQDSNGSQFFIVWKDTPETLDENNQPTSALPADYTIIGTVTAGMDVVQKVAAAGVAAGGQSATDGPPKLPVKIKTVTVGAENLTGTP